MPKVTKKQAAQDVIDRIAVLAKEGKDHSALELAEEAETAIAACRPQDREALEKALSKVLTPLVSSGAELAISSYHDVAGVDEVVEKGVDHVKKAVAAGLEAADMARRIAELLLEARLKMPNKAGLPDVIGSSKYTKNIAHDLFTKAREGVTEEDVHRWATHQSLAKAVRNRMSDVVVDRLRSLDEKPDGFPVDALARAKAKFPKLSTTEAVYALYEEEGFSLPRKGRTELAREDARKRAELLKKAVAGELPAGSADEDEAEADLEAVERLERSFTRLAHRAEKLPAEERAKVKARINNVIVSLAAEAAKL